MCQVRCTKEPLKVTYHDRKRNPNLSVLRVHSPRRGQGEWTDAVFGGRPWSLPTNLCGLKGVPVPGGAGSLDLL